ncbi:MAG: hypothetical protein KC422_04700 [Trueperaceae bacterium]|nr:hypothetical protein [Trueperaceae bacterium]
MRLSVLGKVSLENSSFSRPKPLLLLSYLCLEGPQTRRHLANLFWQDDESDPKKSLQKKLAKLSVVLAQFKKEGAEVFPDQSGLDPLPSIVDCDALEFLACLERKDFAGAVALYRGAFLHDLAQQLSKLEVSPEIHDWVLSKQDYFAAKAQLALLELAEQQQDATPLEARRLAEQAYHLAHAPEPEPSLLNRLNKLLKATGSELENHLDRVVKANLEELSELALKVFLALALQDESNLTIVKNALKLSLSELDEAREELILNGLIDPDTQILAGDLARDWLSERPTERMPLLLALTRSTPAASAYSLYSRIFERTQGFGGMGDLARARKAYEAEAKKQIASLDFSRAAEILAEVRQVESILEAEPETELYFLEAYALERQGLFKEALKLLDMLEQSKHTPGVTALLSVLYWRTGKSEEAKTAATEALKSGLDWLWAKASANNTLGYLALSNEELEQASSHFRKASSLFFTAGEKHRAVGSMSNLALALDQMTVSTEVSKTDLPKLIGEAEQAYRKALEMLHTLGGDSLMEARLLNNFGLFWERRENWETAKSYYLQALDLLQDTEPLELSARLLKNLGMVYLHQGETDRAKKHFSESVDHAVRAGEYLIQGESLANLAFLDNDIDSMEVALELLEQSGNLESYTFYLADYEAILKKNFETALLANDQRKAQRFLKQLGELYEQQDRRSHLHKVKDALSCLLQMTELEKSKDLLMAFIDFQEPGRDFRSSSSQN